MTPVNIFGVASLIFWSLTIVVTVKYVGFILKADNRGEGGIFALLGLILGARTQLSPRLRSAVIIGGIFGAALLYGDGIITPSISVLSAIEGLEVATAAAKPFVVPLTCLVLVALFLVQKRGTSGIGKVFGPDHGRLVPDDRSDRGRRNRELAPHPPGASTRSTPSTSSAPTTCTASSSSDRWSCASPGARRSMPTSGTSAARPSGSPGSGSPFPALLLNYFGQCALLLDHPGRRLPPLLRPGPARPCSTRWWRCRPSPP